MSKQVKESMPYILLVENDPLSQEVGQAILERCGCRVHVVENGRQAVEAFSRQPFDMIFMECRIPELDGYKTAGIIRSMESGNLTAGVTRHTPIVALAASSLEDSREQCLQSGMDDYLSKPYRITDLQAMLDRWLSARHADGEAIGPAGEKDPPAIDQEPLNAIAALQPQDPKAILTKLISLYFSSSLKLMQRILKAVEENDADSLKTAAHTLKSSSASLGAMILAEKCQELEMMAREGVADGAGNRMAPLEREYERVRESLNLYLTSLEK